MEVNENDLRLIEDALHPKETVYILGINPGHNATASLLKDGKIIACVSEERFSRVKNHFGFPHQSIKWCLDSNKITPQDLKYVVLGIFIGTSIYEEGHEHNEIQDNYKHKTILQKSFSYMTYKYPQLINPIIELKHLKDKIGMKINKKESIKEIADYFNINERQVIYIDHHEAHAWACVANL